MTRGASDRRCALLLGMICAAACAPERAVRPGVYSESRDYANVQAALPLLVERGLDLYQVIDSDRLDDPGLRSLLEEAKRQGVGVRGWVVLPQELGYWPGESNLDAFGDAVDQTIAALRARGLLGEPVGWITFDLEPALSYTQQLVALASDAANPNWQVDLVGLVQAHVDRGAFVANRTKLQQIVDRVHAAGLRAHAVTYPIVLDDLGDSDADLEDGFDIPLRGIGWDEVSVMIYRSTWERFAGGPVSSVLFASYAADLKRVFGPRSAVDFGVIGFDPITQATGYTQPAALLADVAATRAAGIDRFHLFDLVGARGDSSSWLTFATAPPPAPYVATPDPAVDKLRGTFTLLDTLLGGP